MLLERFFIVPISLVIVIHSFCYPVGGKTEKPLKPWRMLKGQVKQTWKTSLWPPGRQRKKKETENEYEETMNQADMEEKNGCLSRTSEDWEVYLTVCFFSEGLWHLSLHLTLPATTRLRSQGASGFFVQLTGAGGLTIGKEGESMKMFLVIPVVTWTFDILTHRNMVKHSVRCQNISGGA